MTIPHGLVETSIGELEAEEEFPVDARMDSIGGLAIGQAFHELEQRDEREPKGSKGRLALRRKEISEIEVVEEHVELVVDTHNEIGARKDGAGDASGFRRHEIVQLRLGSRQHRNRK